jgi:hypothetical protein
MNSSGQLKKSSTPKPLAPPFPTPPDVEVATPLPAGALVDRPPPRPLPIPKGLQMRVEYQGCLPIVVDHPQAKKYRKDWGDGSGENEKKNNTGGSIQRRKSQSSLGHQGRPLVILSSPSKQPPLNLNRKRGRDRNYQDGVATPNSRGESAGINGYSAEELERLLLYDDLTTSFPEDSLQSDDENESDGHGRSIYDINREGRLRGGIVSKRWKFEGGTILYSFSVVNFFSTNFFVSFLQSMLVVLVGDGNIPKKYYNPQLWCPHLGPVTTLIFCRSYFLCCFRFSLALICTALAAHVEPSCNLSFPCF